jgi:hypothetical protein
VANNMSWETLAAKKIDHVGGLPPEAYFTTAQLSAAQAIVGQAQGKAREREDKKNESERPRNRVPEKKL